MKKINEVGNTYGNLKVLCYKGIAKDGHTRYECECLLCGKHTQVSINNIKYHHKFRISCGCLKIADSPKRLKNGLGLYRSLISTYKRGAKKRDIIFSLSEKLFIDLTQHKCFYCGKVPSSIYKTTHSHDNHFILYNGIDRVDNTKGYIFDNVVTCCKTCNLAKQKMTVKEFYDWVSKVYRTKEGVET